MLTIKIGCCGIRTTRRKYFETHKIVEIQQTFYKIPSKETLKRWRSEAPKDFEYAIKAWQVITHSPSSPTWRKAGIKVPEHVKDKYGLLRPTKENFDAWNKVIEAAEILEAQIIIVQTPPSFGYTEETLNNAIEFFRKVSENRFIIVWEPRGNWLYHKDKIAHVVNETKIVHCVDPFIIEPVNLVKIGYFRLHGKNHRWPNYKYRYTEEDLMKLLIKIMHIREKYSISTFYVLFNNIYMYEDSLRFKELCVKSRIHEVTCL